MKLENGNTILDKIIQELLSHLKDRPREIIMRRFGIGMKEPQVLDKIGKDFNITRERVRQIERDSFKKLRSIKKGAEHQMLIDQALEIIKSWGGFCEKVTLKEALIENISSQDRNKLMLILDSFSGFNYKKSDLEMEGFWYLKDELNPVQVSDAHRFILKHLKQEQKPLDFSQIVEFIVVSPFAKFFQGELGLRRLEMTLLCSRVVQKNILGQWGIKNWRVIAQRGAREKAFLVLKKHGNPLHFRDITKHININWTKKKALPQTVHNELIKDKRFVLIGRGIYGLKEWGFPEGTVKDIIRDFLAKADVPVHKDDIMGYVLTKKRVKKTTIMVNLADKKHFCKAGEGMFALKEKCK